MNSGRSFFLFALILLVSFVFLQQCKHEIPKLPLPDGKDTSNPNPTDTTNPCDPDTVYFERQILPLLVSNCGMDGCHNEKSHEKDIILTSFDKMIQSDVVKAFDPNGSDLFERITETQVDKIMPPPPRVKLPADQIALIKKWITQGAKNLKCKSDCDTSNVTWTIHIKPFMKANCVGCHGTVSPSGGVPLATYLEVKQAVDNGKILGNVRRDSGFSVMPPGGSPVSKCNIDLIRIWIEKGALEN